MADVFISYASEDRDRVRPLAVALQAKGISVWWDRALAAGDDYAAVIARELAAAKAVVVVWSEASVLSNFVRDEAGRARDGGRLVPVSIDRVELPLGFGALQAEDLTSWNGRAEAPQIELLVESLKARIEGRAVDANAIAAKRKRLMARVRIGAVLTGLAAVVSIAVGINTLWRQGNPAPQQQVQTDPTAELLRALNEGRISGDQAVELARLLSQQAFAGASAPEPTAGAGATARNEAARSADSSPSIVAAPAAAGIEWPQFLNAAEETYRGALVELMQSPRPEVRGAVAQLANPDPGIQAQGRESLQQLAAASSGAEQAAIWRAVGAQGLAQARNDGDRTRAMNTLLRARAQSPGDQRLWTMMSFGYGQSRETQPLAEASALVVQGLEAQSSDKLEEASTALEQALPALQDPASVAFVQERLGDVAAERGEHREAVERYTSAITVQLETLPAADAAQNADLRANSERLARALELGGASARACRTLQRANAAGVEAPDTARTACSERGLWRGATVVRQPGVAPAPTVPANRLELQRAPANPPVRPAP